MPVSCHILEINMTMQDSYDYLIVGAGLFGAICGHEFTKAGKSCLVIDRRDHIGGNCYTKNIDSINLHIYGPHIFHTSDKQIWDWMNQFAPFCHFRYMPVAHYQGELYPLPFNMWTFNKIWGGLTPYQVRKRIHEQAAHIQTKPTNLEEQAIKTVGVDLYERLIKGYTQKQWGKPCHDLPASIIKRLPVRFTYDNNYFDDIYQGIPAGGYTQIFDRLLHNIDVILDADYLQEKETFDNLARQIVYTGPIDAFFNFSFGHLEYKTVRLEHQRMEISNVQGAAVVNYTDSQITYTRVIEHKHFEGTQSDYSWISHEYPTTYIAGINEPYYPLNDKINNTKYSRYKALADRLENVHFGGRLAQYKYYNMDNVIRQALDFTRDQLSQQDS